MATLTIRRLDDETKRRLRIRAAEHGRSMEDEAREILRGALAQPTSDVQDLYSAFRPLVDAVGGVELELPPRGPGRPPPDFD